MRHAAEAARAGADMHSRDWDREQAREWEQDEIEAYERQERDRLAARDKKHRVRLPSVPATPWQVGVHRGVGACWNSRGDRPPMCDASVSAHMTQRCCP